MLKKLPLLCTSIIKCVILLLGLGLVHYHMGCNLLSHCNILCQMHLHDEVRQDLHLKLQNFYGAYLILLSNLILLVEISKIEVYLIRIIEVPDAVSIKPFVIV